MAPDRWVPCPRIYPSLLVGTVPATWPSGGPRFPQPHQHQARFRGAHVDYENQRLPAVPAPAAARPGPQRTRRMLGGRRHPSLPHSQGSRCPDLKLYLEGAPRPGWPHSSARPLLVFPAHQGTACHTQTHFPFPLLGFSHVASANTYKLNPDRGAASFHPRVSRPALDTPREKGRTPPAPCISPLTFFASRQGHQPSFPAPCSKSCHRPKLVSRRKLGAATPGLHLEFSEGAGLTVCVRTKEPASG